MKRIELYSTTGFNMEATLIVTSPVDFNLVGFTKIKRRPGVRNLPSLQDACVLWALA
jgi:hypothetical protein